MDKNMIKLQHELKLSQKNDELTPTAKNMLVDYTNELFEKWYDTSDITNESMIIAKEKHAKIEKDKLLDGGMVDVFKHWENFNCEKSPEHFFKEVFKRSIAKFIKTESREYKDKKFLDSLRTMGLKILKFNLPYEMEIDGSIIRKFHYEEEK